MTNYLEIAERVSASVAPVAVFAIFLLLVSSSALWIVVRRQRIFIQAQLALLRRELKKCEESHRICMARGARRTSMLLQVLAIAETFAGTMRREDDRARLSAIRLDVEILLEEEAKEAIIQSQPDGN